MTKKRRPHKQKHIPQRSCIVCRQKFDKRQLTRIVCTPEKKVTVDLTGKQRGRGAYVCEQRECWERLLQSKGLLNQALKTIVTDEDLAAITQYKVAEALEREV